MASIWAGFSCTKRAKAVQVVLGLVLLARAVADQALGGDRILVLHGRLTKIRLRARVVDQQVLEVFVPQELHGAGEVAAKLGGQLRGEAAEVAVGDAEGGEQLAGLAGHLLVDALEPLDQAADVVVAVPVLPDVLDDLVDRARWASPAARR